MWSLSESSRSFCHDCPDSLTEMVQRLYWVMVIQQVGDERNSERGWLAETIKVEMLNS